MAAAPILPEEGEGTNIWPFAIGSCAIDRNDFTFRRALERSSFWVNHDSLIQGCVIGVSLYKIHS